MPSLLEKNVLKFHRYIVIVYRNTIKQTRVMVILFKFIPNNRTITS